VKADPVEQLATTVTALEEHWTAPQHHRNRMPIDWMRPLLWMALAAFAIVWFVGAVTLIQAIAAAVSAALGN